MTKFSFDHCTAQECHFTNTNLRGVNFTETSLLGSIFHNCNLSYADLSSAKQYAINPQTNQVKKGKFSLPEAVGLLEFLDITIV